MRFYRDLLKHSSIYGVGQILSRLASILLLPVYTFFLRPADYGLIAILDLITGVLAIFIGGGMVAAVNRFHFDTNNREEQARVWWSGMAFVCLASTAICLPAVLARDALANLTLGPDAPNGGLCYALALATVWFSTVGQIPETYLRVRKWSSLSVGLSLGRLLLNIALNVSLLTLTRLGVVGVLLGNLITNILMTLILVGVIVREERPLGIDHRVFGQMMRFGAPLIITAFFSMIMHQADRYLLRMHVGMDQVGVYSLAYQVGQGVNTLFLVPFTAIWNVVLYELAKQPNSKQLYADVFSYFVRALGIVMLGAALFARPLLAVLTPDDYSAAASLVPIVCLAYFLFSLHEHFRVPCLLAKKSMNLIPVYGLAAVVNVLANLALIPRFGVIGAAWASVATFGTFSMFGLYQYRKISRYPYPLLKCTCVTAGLCFTYQAYTWSGDAWEWPISLAVCIGWTLALFGPQFRQLVAMRRTRPIAGVRDPLVAENTQTVSST